MPCFFFEIVRSPATEFLQTNVGGQLIPVLRCLLKTFCNDVVIDAFFSKVSMYSRRALALVDTRANKRFHKTLVGLQAVINKLQVSIVAEPKSKPERSSKTKK